MSDVCSACGASGEDATLGHSEARDAPVCTSCVAFLGEHGHYPDEDGPERSVTVEYELQEVRDDA
jgi:hypothetical protein